MTLWLLWVVVVRQDNYRCASSLAFYWNNISTKYAATRSRGAQNKDSKAVSTGALEPDLFLKRPAISMSKTCTL